MMPLAFGTWMAYHHKVCSRIIPFWSVQGVRVRFVI
jgi:hypothetical protein